jgi:hypothetical protein
MQDLVVSYHPTVVKTGAAVSELICGTAFFPGGCGLWRGSMPFGRLPDLFPDAPVMLVGHNFDSISAYEESFRKGGEAQSFFWRILLDYLSQAGIEPERCFFTNALMGLKPGSAIGPMPVVAGYYDECLAFLKRQIELVQPSLIVALGQKAYSRVTTLQPSVPVIHLLHPSAREIKPLATRHEFTERQAAVLAQAYASVSPQTRTR